MIGIEIKKETSYEQVIYDLLKNIEFNNYEWVISQYEIIFENDNNNDDIPVCLSGKQIKKLIKDSGNYYVLFLNLQVYQKKSNFSKIESYNDFINSSCELIILFSDNSFIEIYFKSDYLKNIIIKNLDSMQIEYTVKTIENDSRKTMIL
jgi:hypothetical protein